MGPRQQRVEAADAVHGSGDRRGHHVLLDVPPSCQRGGDLQSWGLMGTERHVGCFIFRSEFQKASRRWKWGRGLTARLACSLLVALFWLSRPSHRQGPGVPISSFAPSPVKILSSRLPLARMCSSYTRLRDRLREQQRGQKRGEEKRSVDCRGPQMLTNCLQSWWGPESPSGCPPSLWGSVWDGGGRTERDKVRKQTWPGSTLETTQQRLSPSCGRASWWRVSRSAPSLLWPPAPDRRGAHTADPWSRAAPETACSPCCWSPPEVLKHTAQAQLHLLS